ncbi:hypothetical protein AVEN_125853-1 [Araneus ventricosus]|uniref:Uncharacterized protein n=1 Tax=Araneus ventricosus TaxID=182803 RepID=A0A4Y2UE92_ARAVE|nr:hypothetical protein AVEN_125853-1 [Araneus ventricosus]
MQEYDHDQEEYEYDHDQEEYEYDHDQEEYEYDHDQEEYKYDQDHILNIPFEVNFCFLKIWQAQRNLWSSVYHCNQSNH